MATHFSLRILFSLLISLISSPNYGYSSSCYSSIISFGDSLADTGNLLRLSADSKKQYHFFSPPYGESYIEKTPSGRCSDGRLIIDFIAEELELPYVSPYVGGSNFGEGVNFAVVGATVLDTGFYMERGIINPFTNASLDIQLGWFNKMLPHCHTSSDCRDLLKKSIVLMGEIGGNDYNHALIGEKTLDEVQIYVDLVISTLSAAINEMINNGAVTLMVPGNLPIGCNAVYLTKFKSSNKEDYDPATGCLIKLNKFAQHHNEMLQLELNRLREIHPEANIIYADYYNAAMQFYNSPEKYGFSSGALTVCCGGGGPYNYDEESKCGQQYTSACDKPSTYANWDGLHLTESAYKVIFEGLFHGPYTTPQISSLCGSIATS